jgi:hypothetical protein
MIYKFNSNKYYFVDFDNDRIIKYTFKGAKLTFTIFRYDSRLAVKINEKCRWITGSEFTSRLTYKIILI